MTSTIILSAVFTVDSHVSLPPEPPTPPLFPPRQAIREEREYDLCAEVRDLTP